MNPVDTLFVLICAAMVLLMTPALAVFYAGLCRRKSGVDIMMQVWVCLAVVGPLWALIGFSLAFGPDAVDGLLGGADFFLLQGVGLEASPAYSAGIPLHPVLLPANGLRRHYPCPDLRRDSGTNGTESLGSVLTSLEPRGLHPPGPHDLGRRLVYAIGPGGLGRRRWS